MPSRLYSRLVRRISELEKAILPNVPATRVNLSQKEVDLTSAFIVLCHAEFEEFIESHCDLAVKRIEHRWRLRRSSKSAARSIMLSRFLKFNDEKFTDRKTTFFSGVFDIKVNSVELRRRSADVDAMLKSSVSSYKSSLRSNHGASEKYLKKLIYPLGICEKDLDYVLLDKLNEFANHRGLAAHKSVKAATVIPHPTIVKTDVNYVVQSLLKLDDVLRSII